MTYKQLSCLTYFFRPILFLQIWKRCIFCSILVQEFLSAHVLGLLLINIKVHLVSYACAKQFGYSMDGGNTKQHIVNVYQNASSNTLVQW